MASSITLSPRKEGLFTIFLKSQLFTKTQWPPKTTNLEGQVALVTGATRGLGLEAGDQLLSFGLSRLIITARSPKSGDEAAATLRQKYPKSQVDVWPLQMEDYESVQSLARRAGELKRLDIVILNAGITAPDFEKVASTGHEKVIQVNYLSTMLLAILMLPILKAKSPPGVPGRLSIVSSGTALGAKFPNRGEVPLLSSFDNLKVLPWDPVERYWVSKLLGHLTSVDLAQYVNADDVVVNLVDPGLSKGTGLNRDTPGMIGFVMVIMKLLAGRTTAEGASTYLDATIVKGKESHGSYLADWGIEPFAPFVYSPEGERARAQLWKETLAEFEFANVQQILEDLKK